MGGRGGPRRNGGRAGCRPRRRLARGGAACNGRGTGATRGASRAQPPLGRATAAPSGRERRRARTSAGRRHRALRLVASGGALPAGGRGASRPGARVQGAGQAFGAIVVGWVFSPYVQLAASAIGVVFGASIVWASGIRRSFTAAVAVAVALVLALDLAPRL